MDLQGGYRDFLVGRKIEIHLEQIPWSWKFDGKKCGVKTERSGVERIIFLSEVIKCDIFNYIWLYCIVL